MGRVRVDYRLPGDLLARVEAEAARLGQTRTLFVERALESALNPPPGSPTEMLDVVHLQKTGRARMVPYPPVEKESGAPRIGPSDGSPGVVGPAPSRPARKPFRCPIYTCTFEAASSAAVCGRHGRKVIPA